MSGSMRELSEGYVGMMAEHDEIQGTVEALRRRSKEIWDSSHWDKVLVRPMAEAVARELSADGVTDVEIVGPAGLRGENYLTFKAADGTELFMLVVTSGDLSRGELRYDTGGRSSSQPPAGSIGAMSGMGNEEAVLPDSFADIADIVRARPVTPRG